MSIYRHVPGPPLNQFVDFCWYYVDFFPDHDREHVLPDGTFELIINLQETPRKLFHQSDVNRYDAYKRGWISGAHSRFLVIDALQGSSMIGVHFRPGGAAPFLGVPADELGGQVVELDLIWGNAVWDWRDQLLATRTPTARFSILEELLNRRLRETKNNSGLRKAINWARDQYLSEPALQTVTWVSDQVGFSHKHFIELFRREIGLTPKRFCRIRRFQQALIEISTRQSLNWADVAYSCGYFDQSHFVRDFLSFSGLNPSAYLEQRLDGGTNFTRASPANR